MLGVHIEPINNVIALWLGLIYVELDARETELLLSIVASLAPNTNEMLFNYIQLFGH